MPEYKCSLCEYKNPLKSHVIRHINKLIKCGDKPEVVTLHTEINCEFCKKTITTIPNLQKHLKICKIKKINIENDIAISKNEKIEKLEKELEIAKEFIKTSNSTVKSPNVPNKFEETINDLIKLIDHKVLGNTNVETIRSQSRKKYKNIFGDMKCVHCKHIGSTQVCHIKAIKDFTKLSSIEDINHISNLIGLCPNCHIDLDRHKKFEVVRTATLHSMIAKMLCVSK